ncbi:hypothetical protein [Corynebacterium halotolerans]|uniref:hypothetical protein n=1 Tax=Corynebacterium halotolerans TaxID=225326 RepID=UPI003CEF723F
MITTKNPGSDSVESEPDSPIDSVIAVRLPDADLGQQELSELVSGAVTATRLLALPELYLFASAEQLPGLAMAAATVDDIPEGFQLCQLDAESGEMVDLPENVTPLSVESLIRLTRAREAA